MLPDKNEGVNAFGQGSRQADSDCPMISASDSDFPVYERQAEQRLDRFTVVCHLLSEVSEHAASTLRFQKPRCIVNRSVSERARVHGANVRQIKSSTWIF